MIYAVDIDGTICSQVIQKDGSKDYAAALPYQQRIDQLNKLYDDGHTINYITARGAQSGKDWTKLTIYQLEDWGVKYHTLSVGKKPHYDLWIDDKAIHADEFFPVPAWSIIDKNTTFC